MTTAKQRLALAAEKARKLEKQVIEHARELEREAEEAADAELRKHGTLASRFADSNYTVPIGVGAIVLILLVLWLAFR